MRLRDVAIVLASGLAAFLVGVVVTTELLAPDIEFSVFVGIPVGIVAGVAMAAVVALGLGPDAGPGRRRIARSLGTFGVAFLVVLFGGAAVLETGTVIAIVAALVVGLVVAVAAYVRSDGDGSAGAEAGLQ